MNATANASAPVTGPKLDNRRVLAGLIDLAIVVAGAMVVLFAADALSGERSSALSAVILGWTLYYYFAVESGGGQTVGKKVMKLRVVRADGRPAGMSEIAVRTLLRVVDGLGLYVVGLVVMLATGQRRQRIGDLAAGTIVVDASATPAVAVAAPVAEAEAEADEVADEPEPEDDAPVAETATITLPSRPAPAAPELRPFPPAGEEEEPRAEDEEPRVEEPYAEEPHVEAAPAEEPHAEEPVEHEPAPVVELPRAEEPEEPAEEPEAPVLEFAPRVEEPVEDEPQAGEPAGEPVVELAPPVEEHVEDEREPMPDVSTPSLEALARDVAAARAADEDEPSSNADEDEEEKDDDEPIRLRSVETVSAIDLVMGGAPEEPKGPSDDDEPRSA
jgi:uncharacterized RDD family membrane protein YckC